MTEHVPKKDKRGGARPRSGPKTSHVWLNIGDELLADLVEFCTLRKKLGREYQTPVRYLENICRDKIDSPYFKKELERLRVEKKLREMGLARENPDTDMEF